MYLKLTQNKSQMSELNMSMARTRREMLSSSVHCALGAAVAGAALLAPQDSSPKILDGANRDWMPEKIEWFTRAWDRALLTNNELPRCITLLPT